eukprot:CAMPEP_0178864702 /NCGR_PEP_ID=MMETSP0747-20121128/4029_1 /TAXON_ID=913974 /ORGANISM="Nitzschia punctata, Strain CCMP561" /LENGTH=261 /DNA_ID=CAMNT_0020531463 /DNA_START=60 /DNA_END=845 /DNA_ORIENTATION=-
MSSEDSGMMNPFLVASQEADDVQGLLKNSSFGNLTRITRTTAEGTDSSFIATKDGERLIVSLIESSVEPNLRRARCDSVSFQTEPSTNYSHDSFENDRNPQRFVKNQLTPSSLSGRLESDVFSVSLPEGIPSEIVVYNDGFDEISMKDFAMSKADTRLDMYERLLGSYRQRLQTAERLCQETNRSLLQTQRYAQELLKQRNSLLRAVETMEKAENQYDEHELLLRAIMLFSLVIYLISGSHQFLAVAVGLQLFVTMVNLVI